MGQPVITGTQLVSWLRTEYANTYARQMVSINKRLPAIMDLGIPSDKLIEHYGYYLAAPHMRLWRRGENISSKPFKSVNFQVENLDWGHRIEWHENDRRFEQTKTLVDRARDLGRSAAITSERVGFQIMTDASDNDLLQAIPLAPDGVAMYSATDGSGADRFEVTGGNIGPTASGVASPTAIRTDFWNAIEQFKLMRDGEGQPYWGDDILDGGYTIVYGAANEEVFREAFQQRFTQGSAGDTNAVSNIIMDAGLKFQLWSTQRITDNDWFIFLNNAPKKALFQQSAKEPEESFATKDNSDQVRNTKQEYFQVDAIWGFGLSLPISTIKVNN